jgi:S-DNA-T family DNA segregation ATPase FtsK/SpoIIIE
VAKKTGRTALRRPSAGSSRPGKSAGTSASRGSLRRSTSRKPARSRRAFPLSLSRDRKLDLIGVLLIVVGIFSVVWMLTAAGGSISEAWLRILRGGFGWGMFAIPLALLAGGLWLVLRSIQERLPHVAPEQVLGMVLLYLALLTIMHGLVRPQGWAEAFSLARQGMGGGLIGAAILEALVGALGSGGTVVALVAMLLVGIVFTAGISIPELMVLGANAMGWIRRGVLGERAPSRPKRRAGVAVSAALELGPQTPSADRRSAAGGRASEPMPRASVPELAGMAPAAQPAEAIGRPPWTLPDLTDMLEPGSVGKADDEFDRERARLIEDTLLSFGAPARVVEVNRGPTITQFGVEPDFVEGRAGRRIKVKVSKISALADDLALALAAPSIRIEAPVPGKGYVGIEVPNTVISLVALRDVMEAESFQKLSSRLRIGLGQDVSGHAVAADLSAMPHLLIAGTTGSGKSVCVNAIISCLLLQNTPDDLRLVMVDPKRVELTYYNGIPHLLAPVVVDLERVVPALQWVSREMDERYRRFAKEGARNIADFNQRMVHAGQKGLPCLVVIIDELADLMMLAPDETERVITRLAQLARATGIHLVIATQRPSVDVVTGLIKANFPARIAFAVASSVDSRVILDQPGAERLLGRGDMLFQSPDSAAPVRMQGAYVSERELNRLIGHWKDAGLAGQGAQAAAPESVPVGVPLKQATMWEEPAPAEEDEGDVLFDEAVTIVRQMRRASISLLQRRLRIGYTRAARLVDQLEERGIVGPGQQGSQAREVLDYGELAPAEDD